jgi:hypothetical protein
MSFKIEAFQNRHLSDGQTRVDAILSVTAEGTAGVSPQGGRELLIGFIVDSSGSMNGDRISAVKAAVTSAIELLDADTTFFVVAFHSGPRTIFAPSLATPANKRQAEGALAHLVANGGTAMSTGLAEARKYFEQMPQAIRQAVFLTDGKNESETPLQVLSELKRSEGMFECDCWGVGTDWQVGEVQQIAKALNGKASLIPIAPGIAEAFRAAMEKARAKAFKEVRLRLWAPMGTQVVFVKQVNPTIEELTHKGKDLSPQLREYNTGTWGQGESRDFHVALQVKPGKVGDEMLACRPSVAFQSPEAGGWQEQEVKPPEARLFANWTVDDSLSSRIDQHVAHYTGQDELANVIQKGLEAREQGNEVNATQLLGRAVQLAHESDNAEMTHRLAKVVDVVNAPQGTVKLKKNVAKAATMDLQLESHTTKRSKRIGTASAPTDPNASKPPGSGA